MPIKEGIPAYHRLYVMLTEKIRSGQLAAGDVLPSEAALTAEHGVSRVTVRRALDLLVRDGLVDKQQGRGSFVANTASAQPMTPAISGVITNLVASGTALDVETLLWTVVQAGQSVAQSLELETGSPCLLIKRLRRHEGVPVSLTSIYLPESIGARLDEAQASDTLILELLVLANAEPLHTVHRLSAILATGEASERLEVATGSALLQMRGVVYGEDDMPLYYQESVYHPDNYEYALRLDRDATTDRVRWQVRGRT